MPPPSDDTRSRRGQPPTHVHTAPEPAAATRTTAGGRAGRSRRDFLGQGGLVALGSLLGTTVPFARHFPAGLLPVAFAQGAADLMALDLASLGKHPELALLNDRPLNAETPAHLLDDDVTSADRFFVRNNGRTPEGTDPAGWTLTIEGEAVPRPLTLSLAELRARFPLHSYALVLECAGNGRQEVSPPTKGNQWTTGAVGCARFTGVRLRDVLQAAGVGKNAVYVGYQGADVHLSGDPGKAVISRGIPLAKALQDETLLAFAMNDAPLPLLHGAPLRLVVGGWPASTSGKWLTRLLVRDRVHDGAKMTGDSYRTPCAPVRPGAKVPDEQMCIIEGMPVRSLITFPRSGITHPAGQRLSLRGHAWAGERAVREVFASLDFGATWQAARVQPPPNRLAWQRFAAELSLPGPGYYEVWARAVDDAGVSQPMVVPGWNPRGYLNNACHRIAVQAV